MEILKKGSTGKEVKLLQLYLGLPQDGIFGQGTEAVVKVFQTKHNLVSDGIVGNKTWEVLIKVYDSKQSKCIDKNVIYKPLNTHVSKLPNRLIKYIVIHFTAGSSSSPGRALGVYNTFVSRSASADFVVDDRDIVLFNPDLDNYYCWSVGDTKKISKTGGKLYNLATNKNTISIEVCSTCTPATTLAVSKPNHKGWSFTKEVINNTITITKILMKKYNIPLLNVIRHYDITGKQCPGIIGWNDELIYNIDGTSTKEYSTSVKWEEFKKNLI